MISRQTLSTLTLLLALTIATYSQTIKLATPIAGAQVVDFFVVNHVDHDSSEGIRDYECGTKTYDGHQGTDFTLRSFAQMDSGVSILAAADGLVTTVVDHYLMARYLLDLTNLNYPAGAYILRLSYGEQVVGVVVAIE